MNIKNYFSKEFISFLIIMSSIVLIFAYTVFGFAGIRFVFGIIIMWLPFYLILDNFDLKLGEKFLFSLLLGITLFPSVVYLIGFLISFKVSIFVTFLLFLVLSFLIKKLKNKK